MMPWTTLYTVSSVSHAWEEAVQTREIYGARVRSHSVDKLVVINHTLSRGTSGLALYSLQAKACYRLPPIPQVKSGIPQLCGCITLDGKTYILGGLKNKNTDLASKEVYVLDVTRQRQWKQCATMKAPRHSFGCGVIDRKIYVCGGSSRRAPVGETEVYDPKVDAWTKLMPMTSLRTGPKVGILGDELLVYSGSFYRPDYRETQARLALQIPLHGWVYTNLAEDMEAYNPTENEWRILSKGSPGRHPVDWVYEQLFMAEGRLYSISPSAIFAIDVEKNSKTRLHLCSHTPPQWASRGWRHPIFPPRAILAVDNALLTINDDNLLSIGLLRSGGLGVTNEEILWQQAECSLSFESLKSPFMRLLQL